ncbi:eCIS core domain-containing protein [Massilia horti]|nr:DUF4157 domain-containing protein [Massilia horti]
MKSMANLDGHSGAERPTPTTGGMLHRAGGMPGQPAAGVAEVLRSGGRPLDAGLRSSMEGHFGRDLSQVRVHTDARAAESASGMHAAAYTVGRHIAFALGRFAPDTVKGRQLLAHELAHTVQQGFAPAPTAIPAITRPVAADEGEANRVAARVGAGQHAGAIGQTTGGRALVQKQDLVEAPQTMEAPGTSAAGATPMSAASLPVTRSFTVPVGLRRFNNVFHIPASGSFSITASGVMSRHPGTVLPYWIKPITSGFHFNGDELEYTTNSGRQTRTWSDLAGDVDCGLEISTANSDPSNALVVDLTVS